MEEKTIPVTAIPLDDPVRAIMPNIMEIAPNIREYGKRQSVRKQNIPVINEIMALARRKPLGERSTGGGVTNE